MCNFAARFAVVYDLNMEVAEKNIAVIKGSALDALERGSAECIDQLLTALDTIPLPKRLQVASFISVSLLFVFLVVSLHFISFYVLLR